MNKEEFPPEPATAKLALSTCTFGDSPAALYLVEVLNERQDKLLAKAVARTLTQARSLLADIARAHLEYDALSTRTFAQVLTLISAHNQGAAIEGLRKRDPFVANLVANILEGQVKVWKQRVTLARQREKRMARDLPSGVSAGWIPAGPVLGEKNSLLLQQRSKEYLRRKGKRDTLY